MGYGILHMKKMHGGNLSAFGSHIYRDRGKEGLYSNPDIDFTKTQENQVLFRRADNLEKAVNEHITEVFRRKEIARGKRIDPLHPEKAKKRKRKSWKGIANRGHGAQSRHIMH